MTTLLINCVVVLLGITMLFFIFIIGDNQMKKPSLSANAIYLRERRKRKKQGNPKNPPRPYHNGGGHAA